MFAEFEFDYYYTMLVAVRKMVENAIGFAENDCNHCDIQYADIDFGFVLYYGG